jgi:hypothetical protein
MMIKSYIRTTQVTNRIVAVILDIFEFELSFLSFMSVNLMILLLSEPLSHFLSLSFLSLHLNIFFFFYFFFFSFSFFSFLSSSSLLLFFPFLPFPSLYHSFLSHRIHSTGDSMYSSERNHIHVLQTRFNENDFQDNSCDPNV